MFENDSSDNEQDKNQQIIFMFLWRK